MGKVPTEAFPFCGPTYYPTASPVFDAQRSINLFPEAGTRGSKSAMMLIGRPGLSASPFITLATSPVRVLWPGNNRLFAGAGTHFYELNGNGTVKTDYGAMAGSTGVGPMQVEGNSLDLLGMDSSSQQIYNFTGGPGVGVATSVFNGKALIYLDGFYVAIAVGASLQTASPNQVSVSAALNGASWPALNFAIRTGHPDLITQLAELNGQLWVFGERTTEVWYNAGTPTFPFARISGGAINVGLLAPFSVVKFQNQLMWLGADDRGYPTVYKSQGISAQRISTFPIENYIGGISFSVPGGLGATLPKTWCYGYTEAGHTFYVINLVSQTLVPLQTVVYDLTTDMWHERLYVGPYPVCFASLPGAFNSTGPYYAGDGLSGKIFYQGMGYASDGGSNISYIRVAPHLSPQNRWTKYRRFELDADITKQSDGTLGTTVPVLDYSNDGGRSFPGWTTRNMPASGASPTDGFQKYYALQLGRSRDRVFRVTIITNSDLVRLVNAYLDANPGSEK